MTSIVLSFVGKQDPFAREDNGGSIVTLTKHLISSGQVISRVLLLYTDGTQSNAEDTKTWLQSIYSLTEEQVITSPVSEVFSDDPIDFKLAAKEVRKAIENIAVYISDEDMIEFNASSGTPAMKSALSILQAAGYAPNSRVWQIRNPKEMKEGQAHVFATDVNVLKNEFDVKVIKRQINDYNYSGAIASLDGSSLVNSKIKSLLEYGRCRIAFDFDEAYEYSGAVELQHLVDDIVALRSKRHDFLCREAYFVGITKLSNCHYSDFLVFLAAFNENILLFLASRKTGVDLRTSVYEVWQKLRQVDDGKLYTHLQNSKVPTGHSLRLEERPTRFLALAILKYYPDHNGVLALVERLNENKYIKERNDFVHKLEGISGIENESDLKRLMFKILKSSTSLSVDENPFDVLNRRISSFLEPS